jgi:hypothetical protein
MKALPATNYRPLPKKFGYSDHTLEQAWRDDNHAVYRHFGAVGQFIGWEAIRIKKVEPKTIFGRSYPAREVYPSTKDFGRYALSVGGQYGLGHAIEKARGLKTPSRMPFKRARSVDVLDLGPHPGQDSHPANCCTYLTLENHE